HDPEGQDIPHVAGRTLRDDFGIPQAKLAIVPAGITRDQVKKHKLTTNALDAKDTSSRYGAYLKRNRERFKTLDGLHWQEGDEAPCWELESLDPDVLLADLEKVIQGVLDMNLFNQEAAQQPVDEEALKAKKQKILEAAKGLMD